MKYPISKLSMPGVLQGRANGKLPVSMLKKVPGLEGGPSILLAEPAARAYAAMKASAQAAGIILKIGWSNSAYRPYPDQERIFRERYTPHSFWLPGRKKWIGKWWSKKSGVAAAAVPGTSNHGWGLAVDLGEENDGDIGAESLTSPTLQWLLAKAHLFGFSWELQSEPWHVRYVAGDSIPQAVIEFETRFGTPQVKVNPSNKDQRIVLYFVKTPVFGLPISWWDGWGSTSAISPETAIRWHEQGVPSMEMTLAEAEGMRKRCPALDESTSDEHWDNLAVAIGLKNPGKKNF